MDVPERIPFALKDCALISLATGRRAQNLRELRDQVQLIELDSIYYHFWGWLLRPRFEDPEYRNDFASWCRYSIHDNITAERLSVIDPTDYPTLEEMRAEVVEVLEERLEEIAFLRWASEDMQFHFITSQIVVFNTEKVIQAPQELPSALANIAPSSIFYHFIDARRRTPTRVDDFREWLFGFGDRYADLCAEIANVDPFFPTLPELRDQLINLFTNYFGSKV